jgi:hypothetical protein
VSQSPYYSQISSPPRTLAHDATSFPSCILEDRRQLTDSDALHKTSTVNFCSDSSDGTPSLFLLTLIHADLVIVSYSSRIAESLRPANVHAYSRSPTPTPSSMSSPKELEQFITLSATPSLLILLRLSFENWATFSSTTGSPEVVRREARSFPLLYSSCSSLFSSTTLDRCLPYLYAFIFSIP